MNLKAFIAKQIWRTDGYYYIINDDDNVIKAALDKLRQVLAGYVLYSPVKYISAYDISHFSFRAYTLNWLQIADK